MRTGHFALALLSLSSAASPAQDKFARETVVAKITLEIDGGSGPLFRVSSIAIDTDGTVYVAERADHRVRRFRRDGAELATVASGGSGPGEVRAPCCLAITADGFLVIRDNGNGRFVLTRVRGGRDSVLTLPQQLGVGNAEIRTYVSGARFADAGWINWDPRRSPGEYRIAWRSTGGVAGAVTSTSLPTWDSTTSYSRAYGRNGTNGERFAYPLFGRRTLRAIDADGRFASANSDRYVIELHSADGRLITRIDRSDERGAPLTPAERDSSLQQIKWDARRLGVSEGSIPWSVPQRKPPLSHVEFDDDGNLWVEHQVAGGANNFADVFDRNGRYVRSVSWPANVRLRGFARGARRVTGLRTTDDGESVVVLEIPE